MGWCGHVYVEDILELAGFGGFGGDERLVCRLLLRQHEAQGAIICTHSECREPRGPYQNDDAASELGEVHVPSRRVLLDLRTRAAIRVHVVSDGTVLNQPRVGHRGGIITKITSPRFDSRRWPRSWAWPSAGRACGQDRRGRSKLETGPRTWSERGVSEGHVTM